MKLIFIFSNFLIGNLYRFVKENLRKIGLLASLMFVLATSVQAYTLICWGSESGCKGACAKLGGSWDDRGSYSRCTVAIAAPRPLELDPKATWQFSCDATAGAQCAQSCKNAKGEWNQSKNTCTSTLAKTMPIPAELMAQKPKCPPVCESEPRNPNISGVASAPAAATSGKSKQETINIGNTMPNR